MTKFKKKSATTTTIADEVAALHGVTKRSMRPLTKSVFTALVKQLFEYGRVNIPGMGSMKIEMSIRSGTPRTFVQMRLAGYIKAKEKTILKSPENLDFVNYLLERDATSAYNRETNRLKEREFHLGKRALRANHERGRVAAAIKELTGIEVDQSLIAEEHLIPPLSNTPHLPGHRTEVCDLIAADGVFPREKLFLPAHLRGDTPPSSPPTDNVPS